MQLQMTPIQQVNSAFYSLQDGKMSISFGAVYNKWRWWM